MRHIFPEGTAVVAAGVATQEENADRGANLPVEEGQETGKRRLSHQL